nr:hypothetical protein GCM10023233_30360 [Brevibacterium otitidis]
MGARRAWTPLRALSRSDVTEAMIQEAFAKSQKVQGHRARESELGDLDKLGKQSRGLICLNSQNEVKIVIRGRPVALHLTTPLASVN